MKSQAVGLSLAVAIALHNVPEGVAVALPVYFATKSRWLGFKYAFLSGVLPSKLCQAHGFKHAVGHHRNIMAGLAQSI